MSNVKSKGKAAGGPGEGSGCQRQVGHERAVEAVRFVAAYNEFETSHGLSLLEKLAAARERALGWSAAAFDSLSTCM